MAQKIVIPRMGLTMTEGIVAKWFAEDGAQVSVGDPVYELEFDKATSTVEAKKTGILKRLVEEGAAVPVGVPVGVIVESGEDLQAVMAQYNVAAGGASAQEREKAETDKQQNGAEKPDVDAVIIGGGPGGYVAAIRLGLRGAKVILVEKDRLGGTCLNRGCIPTKALLQSAERYVACLEAEAYGVRVESVGVNAVAINTRKQETVDTLVKGVSALLKARKVEVVQGTGTLMDAHHVSVKLADGSENSYHCGHIIIATGSVPTLPPIPGITGANVITSDEALDMQSIPQSLIIIGGGVIGMELGSVYASLGCRVSVLEALPEILPSVDGELARAFRRSVRRKMDIRTGAMVTGIEDGEDCKKVSYKQGEKQGSLSAQKVLVAIGRKPCIQNLGLEEAGVQVEKGCVAVNEAWQTNLDSVWCIGDANGKCMLAHAASAQGMETADRIMKQTVCAGNKHSVIPGCVYTMPELGSVGKTEEQLKEEKRAYKSCRFNLRANGRSLILGQTDGLVKLLADEETNEILGAHIMGPYATELIAECALAMRQECCLEELADTIHAHPTVGEAIMEAAEQGLIGAIHSL